MGTHGGKPRIVVWYIEIGLKGNGRMNTKHLEYFLGVCEAGSISKAAAQMFISPQGLSRIVTALEQELDCSLFARSAKGIQLTPAGRILETYSHQILTAVGEMHNALGMVEDVKRHPLWVACSYSVLDYLPRTLLSRFRMENPTVDLMVSEYPYPLAEKMVLEGKFDFGLGYAPIDQCKFDHLHINTLRWPVMIHRDNPLSQKGAIAFTDLAGQDFYLPNSNYKGRQIFLKRCKDLNLYPNIAGTVNDLSESYQIVKQNKGIAFSIQGIEQRISDPEVITVYLHDEVCCSELVLYYPKNVVLQATAGKFYQFMKEYSATNLQEKIDVN